MTNFNLKMSLGEGLKKLKLQSPGAFQKSMEIGALTFLEWSANGTSPNDSSRPPIHDGFLRGSGSAFVGSKFVGVVEGQDNREATRQYSGKDNEMTVGYNADYAEAMHEKNYSAKKDGERKWLENHINNDKESLYDTITNQFKKELGKILPKV